MTPLLRRLIPALWSLVALALAGPVLVGPVLVGPVLAEMQEVRLGDRGYLIDLPATPNAAPMILALHGGGGNPAQFARASNLGGAATARGYAVVFPAGTSRRGKDRLLTWNAGYCCGYAAQAGVDDDAFLKAVIADASARFGLDGQRVFLTGMSNGAIMAETFASRNPGRVAAVAGVSGAVDEQILGHRPRRAQPWRHDPQPGGVLAEVLCSRGTGPAVAAPPRAVDGIRSALVDAGDAGADRGDDTCALVAEGERQAVNVSLGGQAHDELVRVADAGGGDLEQDLARAGLGGGDVDDLGR